MNPTQDEVNFQRLSRKHAELEARLTTLAGLRFPSEAEQLEESTLKKQKLKIKDEIELLLAARTHPPARNG